MTESEALKTLEDLQRLLTNYRHISAELTEANGIAIKALEEIQQYRAIGLSPELIEAMQGHNIAMINDLGEYQAIGTVEDCREAVERMKPKKPRWHGHHFCPNCNSIVYVNGGKDIYCPKCGQKLDWSE